jgi:hypothetical protein
MSPSVATMTYVFAMPRARLNEKDAFVREALYRALRFGLVAIGLLIVVAGVLIAPLPGPMGLPVVVVGLMIVLRNSFRARKQFIRFQRAHPKMVFPLRRLLRREPEVMPVAWQQALRMERLVLPKHWRRAVRWRKGMKRRAAAKAAAQ